MGEKKVALKAAWKVQRMVVLMAAMKVVMKEVMKVEKTDALWVASTAA